LKTVKDILRRDTHTVSPETPLDEVIRMIDANDIQRVAVVDPEGKEHNIKLVTKMGESIAYFGDTVKPGLYTVQAEGAPPRTYSVSLPAGEGNPAALTSNEKKWISDSANIRMVDNIVSLRRAIENETGVNDLCSQILAATLLALAAESILAAKCSGEKQKELQRKT
ncbi:MAG: CBS domain-containing protein, partial [Verrucomicrobiota bacterium]